MSSSTFFNVLIGTRESSFTQLADSFLRILSAETPKSSESMFISSSESLSASRLIFPGTSPTMDALPFPASIMPFRSRTLPLTALSVVTLTLSFQLRLGNITRSFQINLYSSSFASFLFFPAFSLSWLSVPAAPEDASSLKSTWLKKWMVPARLSMLVS